MDALILIAGSVAAIVVANLWRATWRPASSSAQPDQTTPSPDRVAPGALIGKTLSGQVSVLDGTTLRIKGITLRLAGLEGPKLDAPWGSTAKWALVEICDDHTVTATLSGERSHDRVIATCTLPDGRDIGAELIKRGLALDLARFSGGKYRHLEPADARVRLGKDQGAAPEG